MPILVPEQPGFTTDSERKVWELLRDQLGDDDVLISGQRVSARDKDHEIDICVAFEGAGIVVVEVKGGQVWYDEGWESGELMVDMGGPKSQALQDYVASQAAETGDA